MGCCCTKEITDGGVVPETNPKSSDNVKHFEYRYPFYRMNCKKMFARIYGLEKDLISFGDLQNILVGQIWNN